MGDHAACMWARKNAYIVLSGGTEGERLRTRIRYIW
jgi:hypothetical protein